MSLQLEEVAGRFLVDSKRKLINGEILIAYETILKVHLNSHNLFSATGPLFKSRNRLENSFRTEDRQVRAYCMLRTPKLS